MSDTYLGALILLAAGGVGTLVVSYVMLWFWRVVKRICLQKWRLDLSNRSDPDIPGSDPADPAYRDQAARCIYDVSTTLSQAHVILTRIEPILEALEAILPQVRDELRNAQNRPGKPFTVKRSMGED